MPTTTSNMSLSVPIVGESTYPTSTSNSYTAIDTHDHTSGKGVQIVTGGITDLAVTTAKIDALAVTTAKIDALAVTTAKIAALNVTRAKIEAVGQQVSASTSGTITSTSYADVSGITVTLTTSGRPVYLSLKPLNPPFLNSSGFSLLTGSDISASASLKFLRDSTDIAIATIAIGDTGGTGSTITVPANFTQIDTPAAGTYVYKLQAKVDNASHSLQLIDCQLIAFEF